MPSKIYNAMLEGNYGHFARVLVDVDLSKDISESLMIEREGRIFLHLLIMNICHIFTKIV